MSQIDGRKCEECTPRLQSDTPQKLQKEVKDEGESKKSKKEGTKDEEWALCPIFLNVKEKKHKRPGNENENEKEPNEAICPIFLDLDAEGRKYEEPKMEKKKNKNDKKKEVGSKNNAPETAEPEWALCPIFLDDA